MDVGNNIDKIDIPIVFETLAGIFEIKANFSLSILFYKITTCQHPYCSHIGIYHLQGDRHISIYLRKTFQCDWHVNNDCTVDRYWV